MGRRKSLLLQSRRSDGACKVRWNSNARTPPRATEHAKHCRVHGSTRISARICRLLLTVARLSPIAFASAGSIASSCTDTPGFSDAYGTCKAYRDNKWCSHGATGSAWQPSWGALGAQAKNACCACGKHGSSHPVTTESYHQGLSLHGRCTDARV